jgi:hypothetical protein
VGTETIPFDLSGGLSYAPATFDCPGPACIELSLKNDVWYDFVAPIDGFATFDTCGTSDQDTPDTGLVVYDGCECPADDADVLGCNDFQFTPCFLGAKVENVPVVAGRCYKVRLGGHLGGTPAGSLKITTRCNDCNNNTICDPCDISCNNPGCNGVVGCGQFPDGNGNQIPDVCEAPALASQVPACDDTLPRFQNNAVELTFAGPMAGGAPAAGQVLVQELLAGGGFGPDLSANFTFTVVSPTVLRVRDNAATLVNGKWYGIRNTGGWSGSQNFEVDYVAVYGDSNNDRVNDFGDLSFIFAFLGPATPTDRSDVNSDGVVDFGDLSAAFSFIGSFDPGKPDNHACSPVP